MEITQDLVNRFFEKVDRDRSSIFYKRGDRSGAYTHPEMRPRGEDHGMAKLTWEQVREIRSRYKWLGIGGDSAQALAKEFGISRRNVCGIVNYDTWKE